MDIKAMIQEKMKGTKAGFKGIQVNAHVENEGSSKLVVDVTASGFVDFPGDTVENVVSQVMALAGLGKPSEPSGE